MVPYTHSILIYGTKLSFEANSLQAMIYIFMQYIIGVVFFASRFPERWFPGKFDIFGSSHQIWHVLVFTAILTQQYALNQMADWWHGNNPQCIHSPSEMLKLFA